MKIVALFLLLALTACGADQATINRDTLGTSQTILVAAQGEVLKYRARPPCSAITVNPCRNPASYAEMQRLDSAATSANNAAYTAVKQNASTAKLAIDAATAAIRNFSGYTKDAK